MKIKFLEVIAAFVEMFAIMGTGLASWGPGFQSKMPDDLR